MTYLEQPYSEDGFTLGGRKIPDLPVIDLRLHLRGRRQALAGPALVDTGFDGGVYANLAVASYLEGLRPKASETLGAVGHTVECEIYEASSCRLGESGKTLEVGLVDIYVPTDPADLDENVLVGREVLNQLEVYLNGRKLRIRIR